MHQANREEADIPAGKRWPRNMYLHSLRRPQDFQLKQLLKRGLFFKNQTLEKDRMRSDQGYLSCSLL